MKTIITAIALFIGGLVLALMAIGALALIFAFPVMWLWNWTMIAIFAVPVITYWQSFGLLLLTGLLVKGGSTDFKSK